MDDGDKALLVAATGFEVRPTLDHFGCNSPHLEGLGRPGATFECNLFDCLVTGVGQLQCSAHLANHLAAKRYKYVIQAGVAGSFSSSFPKCSVVRVTEELLGDLGAESGDTFLDIAQMNLLPNEGSPFRGGVLKVSEPYCARVLGLPGVRSVTVNRTLANPRSIEWIRDRFKPDIVNMEGAALFYVCSLKSVPFIELRAISDMVGPRDKSAWDIPGAVQALNSHIITLLETGFELNPA
jgi:futalosine hydrolase